MSIPRQSPFANKPMLVFWETTKACLLACQHCRARAQRTAVPGELTTTDAEHLLTDIKAFDGPSPIVVFTGGDLLMRPDIFHLLDVAQSLGLRTAAAPSVTPLLNAQNLARFAQSGVRAISLSLDGPQAIHDRIRGIPGTFSRTIQTIREAHAVGLTVQINSVVMRSTVEYLPELVSLLRREGVGTWEVFFLITTGRANRQEDLSPPEWDDVCHFLLDVTGYELLVRTVEGPFVRRVLRDRQGGNDTLGGPLYDRLRSQLQEREGSPARPIRLARTGTLDGDGIIFVSHDGWIMPGGFLPIRLGHVRRDPIAEVYRTHPLLEQIRTRQFSGACGTCPFGNVCGGSRARSFAYNSDPLGSDPACPFLPAA